MNEYKALHQPVNDKHLFILLYFLSPLFMFCRCECGNCSVLLLQNISECYCGRALEGYLESTENDLTLQDIGANVTLQCITQHPGLNPVCLQNRSLRLVTAKFETKGKQQYIQKVSEQRLVSVIIKGFGKGSLKTYCDQKSQTTIIKYSGNPPYGHVVYTPT